nr:ribonuclease H-like domain-containing protein [Tanacetum cinerariifolium]
MIEDDNHDGDKPETSNPSQPIPPPTQQIPHIVLSIKLLILKNGEYDIWAIKMEHYLSHTDYPIWKVIENGNGHVSVTTDTNGMIRVLPPKTAEEVVARENERKARATLLMALPEDPLAKFHKMDDAKEMSLPSSWSQVAGVSYEDANQKFLRSLPSSWSQVALIVSAKLGLDTLSFDDLYNNLRVFERDVKGTTASSSSNIQNVAFVSTDNTSSTNYINDDNMEEVDLKWQVAMISMRIKKFYKRTGIKLQFDTKDLVGFDKTKVECFNCHKMGHFARDCKAKGNQDSRRRDGGYNGNKARDNSRRPVYQDDSKALVTIDGEVIDWSGHVEEDTQNFAMMAYSSSNTGSDNKSVFMNKECDLENTPVNDRYAEGMHDTSANESDSKPVKYAFSDSNSSVETTTSMPEPVDNAPKIVCEPKVWTDAPITEEYKSDSDDDSVSNAQENIEEPSFDFADSVKHVKSPRENVKETCTPNHCPKIEKQDRHSHTRKGLGYAFTRKSCFVCGSFSHLIRDCDFHKNRMAKQAALTKSKERDTAVKVSAGCNWRNKRNNWNKVFKYNSGLKIRKSDDPYKALKDKGIVNSGCSRHMIGNKAHLADYQEFKGGSVAFGGSNGRITGKETIKAGGLDLDVYYVEELKHYNLFFVSQMCDKKNKVLFTDTDCLVLSPNFKLPDENKVLLKIPRQHNMYNFNLKNIDPSRDLSCLFAKALLDKSNKRHRRLGHVNFKNLNKLVKENLVKGLPSKIFENDHTCVACQKGKQHKASCKAKTGSRGNIVMPELHSKIVAERKNKTLIEAARTMLADLFLPTTFWEEEELEKLKRQEKEANEALKKEATHETHDVNTNSTNLLNAVSTPVSVVGPSR